MLSSCSIECRRLLFGWLTIILLAFAQTAAAADYASGVDQIDGVATLWFTSVTPSTQSIAHYNINGGAQQNVGMNFNGNRSRYELALNAAAGDTVNAFFTYFQNGLAYDSPWSAALVPPANQEGKVATPGFLPAPGTYASAQQVVVSSSTADATLMCSINGAPHVVCPSPLSVTATTSISAMASKAGMSNSDPANAVYTIGGGNPDGFSQGVQDNGASITVWFAQTPKNDWVDLHYVINNGGQQNVRMNYGADRHELSIPVSPDAPVSLNYSFTYMTTGGAHDANGLAWSRGTNNDTVATPVFSPDGGSFNNAQQVSISTTTAGAAIYYTLDGNTPNAGSQLYSAPFTVGAPGASVKALALKSGMNNSAIASAAFTITQEQAAAPVFAPAGGTYNSAQNVSLTSATPNASIYYAIDGGTPILHANGSAVNISASSTISAYARVGGMADSATVSASYTINSTPGEDFAHGVAEDGATARIWFAPSWTPTTAIVHYYITESTGSQGSQRDESMAYDSQLQRWQGPSVSPISPGSTMSYFFTYSAPAGGNKDSIWYHYVLCGDDAPVSAACPSALGKPTFAPAGGIYPEPQNVTLNLPADAAPGTTIFYTLDGSAPSIDKLQYNGAPINISGATTINAIAVQPDQQQSRRASATYDIEASCTQSPGGCDVAPPVLSHASGTYATRIGINMLTQTPGATVHYTKDGSTPSATSPQFNGAVWVSKSDLTGDTTTIKALATKHGKDSPIVEYTYTITANAESTWNGLTTFNVVNGTDGKYTDDQVYWMIIGKDWASGNFVRADQNGNLIPVSEGDNVIPVPSRDKGYANYAISLAQAKTVTIPPIESARIYMSVGKPVLVQINRDINGKVGYAGPDLENSTDPNLEVTFDFGEFNINRPRPASDYPGIFVNTSRVDIFGMPLKLRVTGLDGYDATVGETLTETRDELFARYVLETPAEFQGLAKAPYAPYRITAPAHGTFNDGVDVKTGAQVKPRGPNADYLDDYISQIWDKYRSEDLILQVGNWPQFIGRVGYDNVLTFTDGQGSYRIYDKPSTTEVMLGNGVLDDATGTEPHTLVHDKQLQLQAQICAALNRHVAEQPAERWYDAAYFYPAGSTANFYTKFWHEHSFNGLAYGFSYDDVGGHSPSIYTPSPVSVTYTIGK